MEQKQSLAELVAAFDPAADVDDLDTARRLITYLRAHREKTAKDAEPIEGEFTAFLDETHARMLRLLYTTKRLGFAEDPNALSWRDPPEIEEAFSNFVEGALDVV